MRSGLKLLGLFALGTACLYGDAWLRVHCGKQVEDDWWFILIRPLGEAIVIGSLFGAVVEEGARLTFIKEVAREGLAYLLGDKLPPSIKDRIQELTHDRLIRRSVRMLCLLEESPGSPSYYQLTVYLDWDVQNFSFDTIKYEPYFSEEAVEQPSLLYIACNSPEKERFYAKTPATRTENGVVEVVTSPDRVRSIPPGSERFSYRMAYSLGNLRRESDWHPFAFFSITEGVTIEVRAPEKLKVGVYPNRASAQQNVWIFDDVFLKGQHVSIHWRLR